MINGLKSYPCRDTLSPVLQIGVCVSMSIVSVREGGSVVPPQGRVLYRARNKGLYLVARNFFLLLLNCSAWTCLAVA